IAICFQVGCAQGQRYGDAPAREEKDLEYYSIVLGILTLPKAERSPRIISLKQDGDPDNLKKLLRHIDGKIARDEAIVAAYFVGNSFQERHWDRKMRRLNYWETGGRSEDLIGLSNMRPYRSDQNERVILLENVLLKVDRRNPSVIYYI